MSRLAFFFALSLLALAPFASADIPHLISLQGRLTDASNNPLTSTANFVFRIYASQTGGTPAWTETQNSIPLDTLGIFSVLLGSANALSIPFDSSYWLEVQVQSGTGPAQVLFPRTRMGSAGYALRSESPWNATGNDIYTTNAGNVGIGTATPAQKLTVAGDISWTGTLQGGTVPWARLASFPSACPVGQYASAVGSSLTCSAPAAGISGSGTANYLPKWTGGTTLGNSIIYDNGNVGIGTGSPGAKLDVNGNTKTLGSDIFAQSDNTNTAYWAAPIQIREAQYGATGGYLPPRLSFHWGGVVASQLAIESDGAIAVRDNPGTGYEKFRAGPVQSAGSGNSYFTGGNVGIGTASPGAKLDVAGDIKTAGFQMPTGAKNNYVLTSDANGVARWWPPNGTLLLTTTGIYGFDGSCNWVSGGSYRYSYAPNTIPTSPSYPILFYNSWCQTGALGYDPCSHGDPGYNVALGTPITCGGVTLYSSSGCPRDWGTRSAYQWQCWANG